MINNLKFSIVKYLFNKGIYQNFVFKILGKIKIYRVLNQYNKTLYVTPSYTEAVSKLFDYKKSTHLSLDEMRGDEVYELMEKITYINLYYGLGGRVILKI